MTQTTSFATTTVRRITLDDPRWDGFVDDHPNGPAFVRTPWLRALQAECDQPQTLLACEREDGVILGVLPLVATRGMPFGIGGPLAARRLASLPRTPIGGPLTVDGAATLSLLDAACDIAQSDGRLLEIKRPSADIPPHHGLVGSPWRSSFVVTLPDDPDALRFGSSRNHGRVVWAVRRAERAGVRVRVATSADVDGWYRLYLETVRFHMIPARSKRFFEVLLDASGANAELLVAEHHRTGSRPVMIAGALMVAGTTTVAYAFNGVDRSALGLRPNDLLQWTAIHRAIDRGARRYDMGEVPGVGGLADFKRKWGADETTMFRYYGADERPADPVGAEPSSSRTAWRRVPLPITRLVGTLANTRL